MRKRKVSRKKTTAKRRKKRVHSFKISSAHMSHVESAARGFFSRNPRFTYVRVNRVLYKRASSRSKTGIVVKRISEL